MTDPEPLNLDDDLVDAWEAVGVAVAQDLLPLVRGLQSMRDALRAALEERQAALESLAEVIAFTERAGVRPNWLADREMMDRARALTRALTTNGDTDGQDADEDHPGD